MELHTMSFSGRIEFPNNLTESTWDEIVRQFNLVSTASAELINPATGDGVLIEDPPNLLAKHDGGIIRCSRLFFDGGVSQTAEISFDGDGEEFEQMIASLSAELKGNVSS